MAGGHDRRALARALTAVENETPEGEALLQRLAPRIGQALRLGVTGPPGVGKSSLVNALVRELRRIGRTVAVVAVDPSSPTSGGALLGDRVRMGEHALDPGVFVRSLASRGQGGGLSGSTGSVMDALDGHGFEVIVLETVGVGQAELDVVQEAEVVLVVLAPGTGDGIQALKSGLIEIADHWVVNKADDPGAEATLSDLSQALLLRSDGHEIQDRIHLVSARDGRGIPALAERLWSESIGSEAGERRSALRRRSLRTRLLRAAMGQFSDRLEHVRADLEVESLSAGTSTLASAARSLLTKTLESNS